MSDRELLPGLDVSRETYSRLKDYEKLLFKWNSKINLVSKSTLSDFWGRHILDSAQFFSLFGEKTGKWVDLGSGGGFPGLVVAILSDELGIPNRLSLVEADVRKSVFLKTVCRELGLKVDVYNNRIEELPKMSADVLSARALAPLKTLCFYAEKHLKKDILFIENSFEENVKEKLQSLSNNQIALYENTRFHDGEEKNDQDLAMKVAQNADYFVNDALSVSHRSHVSTVGIAKCLPSFSGRYLEKEVLMINKSLSTNSGERLGIIGGSKISTKLKVLENLTENVDKLFVGGGMANTFLLAKGFKIGKSLCERSMINTANNILLNAERNNCEIDLHFDALVAKDME